ncbi:MAG: adenosine deaminase [Ruminococcus sp.]|nr:adenosine deaminase [Ruminococcus sp.]
MNISEKINSLSCCVDLHLHLDGSVSVKSARELSELENISLPEDDESLRQLLMVSDDCRDLNEYLEKFSLPVSLMQSEKSVEKCTYNLCCELKSQGLIYAEIRFAPQKHCLKGVSQRCITEAAIKGIKKSGFKAQLILCCMRDGADNKAENLETVSLASEFLGKGVCACDLAGAEALFPNENYEYFFSAAEELGVPFTVHSGEALGASSVEYALRHGAFRIGHGVRAAEDTSVTDILKEKNIPLEICPTSNINTCVFGSISEMPIPYFMEKGITVTINTDNMSVSSTNIKIELAKVCEAFGFGSEELKTLLVNSVRASFADELLKKSMLEEIEKNFLYSE